MEPVGFAAAIITLTKTTTTAIRVLRSYNDSEEEVSTIERELESLQAVLQRLAWLEQEANNDEAATGIALPTLMDPWYIGVFKRCQKEVEGLSSRLSLQDSSRTRRAIKQLRWPFKKKETEEIVQSIRNLTESILQTVQLDQTSMILKMNNAMRSENKVALSAQKTIKRSIYQSFAAVDPSLNYRRAKHKRHPKTASWFIESDYFNEWKSRTPSFCWPHGIIGSGKTVMSSVIIGHMSRECSPKPRSALAYFYFDFSDLDKMSPENMLRSLIEQFCRKCRDIPLLERVAKFREPYFDPDAYDYDLLALLIEIIDTFEESFIVIDALDVCSNVSELLHIIRNILCRSSSKVHILSTSRQEKCIEDEVNSLPGNVQKATMNKTLVNRDICTYVQECLKTNPKFKRWDKYSDILKAIENRTINKADGMFQWAVCQLEVLGDCFNEQALRAALGSPPKSLNDMYEQILRDTVRERDSYTSKMLHWLAFACRPLTIAELAEMLTIDLNDDIQFDSGRRFFDPREILNICPPLVRVDVEEGRGDVVKLVHLSIKEFIVSDDLSTSTQPVSQYHISESSGNTEMAEICLAYLLHFFHETAVEDGVDTRFPLARYASRYWVHHVRSAKNITTRIRILALKLLSSNSLAYLNWIRLYDPERPTSSPNYQKKRSTIYAPLYYMALTGSADLTKLLLEEGTQPDSCCGSSRSPLQAACALGHVGVARQLIAKGADVNFTKVGWRNALWLATAGGHTETVQLLLEKGADVNASGPLLQDAAARGHADVVKLLLQKGQDPNKPTEIHGTALQAACRYGHGEVVDLLLENGADFNIQSGIYEAPLLAACVNGHLHICTQLLLKGANPNTKCREYGNALNAAASKGHLRIVEELVQNGATVDIVDSEGGIPLQSSLAAGHESIAQLLLSKGANPRWKGGMYDNVLQAASRGGVQCVVKSLIASGVDVNTSGGKYGTALQAAASRDHVEIIKMLIDCGASINAEGGYYGSALHAASSNGYENTVQVLLSFGANVNILVGKFGCPIQEAAVHGHSRVVRRLLDNGADINSSAGRRGPISILEFATRRGHTEVVQTILQWASDTHVELNALEVSLEAAAECDEEEIAALLKK
ncbi:hypothetical protein GX51_06125 [Blastomyces parvus]|uniref:Uncharacterized protein n=1 Tax=Blastomyces parvus TaxID=2060905 RepID=A0A2B7WKD5_9EURO|nr:hypothetical protein GX51_06125 [Blastomyces parvus]